MDSAYSKSPNPVLPRIELNSKSASGMALFIKIVRGSSIPTYRALAMIIVRPHDKSINSALMGSTLLRISAKDAWRDNGRNRASVSRSRPFNHAPKTYSVEYLSGNESALRCKLWTR